MYLFAYACMYGLFCTSMYESYRNVLIGLTITLDCQLTCLTCCDAPFLVCSLINSMLSQVSKGRTHLTLHVLEPLMHLPWFTTAIKPLLPTKTSYLPLCEIEVKELPYNPLL